MSFKLKLAFYFLVLALLPLAAAYAGFGSVVSSSETRLVDARLHAGLRAATAAYDEELEDAADRAAKLAGEPAFQRALANRDREAIVALLAGHRGLTVRGPGIAVGPRPEVLAASRRVEVVGPQGRKLGAVVAVVPLDRPLVRRLLGRSGLESHEHVLVLAGGRIVAASGSFHGPVSLPGGETRTLELTGTRYRALGAQATDAPGRKIALAVLSPQARIDAARNSTLQRLLGMLAITLLLVVTVAYLQGRSIVVAIEELVRAARAVASGRLHQRVPVRGNDELALLGRTFNEMAEQLEARVADLQAQRRRLRDATVAFGEALGSTHDSRALLQSVAVTIVGATASEAAVVHPIEGEQLRVGPADLDESLQRMTLPLRASRVEFGVLELFKARFDDEDREAAVLLAGQAVVALENARLHRIVEREARVDELTGLANRRQAERSLDVEISRATRFGSPLSTVVIDLDDFKRVNDVHGHQAGDAVLQELADVLRDGLRQFDVAARWGGEEFLVVLPGTDAEGAEHVAKRLGVALARRVIEAPGGAQLRVTASFGVAELAGSAGRHELVRTADAALYEAKRAGKNRVVVGEHPAAIR